MFTVAHYYCIMMSYAKNRCNHDSLSSDLTLRKFAIWMSKNAKNLIKISFLFFKKITKNCNFSQKLPLVIFLKKLQLLANVLKKNQVFGNLFTLKWQFSGGSGSEFTFLSISHLICCDDGIISNMLFLLNFYLNHRVSVCVIIF